MKTYAAIMIGAITAAHLSEAFQPSISRRALLSNVASASSAVVFLPNIASAAEPKQKKELLRGGKNLSDALHNGTDLNEKEGAVASGLLDKMGLVDITPDKGTNVRAPPTPKKR
jgi:hypothetical protein